MKTKSILSILAALAVVLFLSQCGGSRTEEVEGDDETGHASTSDEVIPPSAPQFAVDKTFQDQLVRVLDGYLTIKDAFVASDPAAVNAAANRLKVVLKSVETSALSGTALNDWANYSNNMTMAVAEITGSTDIEVQRTAFSALSENLYKSIKAYGLGGVTTYYVFCPMAFNDQGGYWLSNSQEIRNPYFGDKMLSCGRVTEELN